MKYVFVDVKARGQSLTSDKDVKLAADANETIILEDGVSKWKQS